MGRIDYQKIYQKNQDEWKALTREPQKYEALLAGHYSDSNHFVYELLQNAEDENATKVVIEYYKDQLVFYHNGDPFDEGDVIGVSSMLMGTKDRNDAQTIGRFGMGFKSVFKYTYQPEIYSDDEAFVIKNYLLPVEVTSKWNYKEEISNLSYPDGGGYDARYYPFRGESHLTKIVIPFKKYNDKGEVISVNGQDVLDKLKSLSGEILLFLSHIRNLYWINCNNAGYVHITLNENDYDEHLLTCRMISSGKYGKAEHSRYLRYRRVFDHPDMKSAEVSVAYKLNAQASNINEMESTPIWVYFPTRDMTDLPFLIHGSFETAVSREKLMTPSQFNADLFKELGNLIADSMEDLAQRKLITQMFLRRIVIAAFKDEAKNGTIRGLKTKLTNKFSSSRIIPDRAGNYRTRKELMIAVPFQLADISDFRLFKDSFPKDKFFIAFNQEKDRNFTEYYNWLTDDLVIRTFALRDWAAELNKLPVQSISASDTDSTFSEVRQLYNFLSNYRESQYQQNVGFARVNTYEAKIREYLPKAWDYLRKAPIILNWKDELVPASDGKSSVYLNASSNYHSLPASSIVSFRVAKDYETLFRNGFQITEFDNYQYVKEQIIPKYERTYAKESRVVVNEQRMETAVEDLQKILDLIEEHRNTDELIKALRRTYIVKVKSDNGQYALTLPSMAFTEKSDEGMDLESYYSGLNNYSGLNRINRLCIDARYYEEHGITINRLKKIGIETTPVREGIRSDLTGTGDRYWIAQGDYCPNLTVYGLEENLKYIQDNRNTDLAKRKSSDILHLFLKIWKKLIGEVRRRKNNPYYQEEMAYIVYTIDTQKWLYGTDGRLYKPSEMSRYELDESIYGKLSEEKEAYTVLGFISKEADEKAETFEKVDALDRRDKTIVFRQLAKELGYDLSSIEKAKAPEKEDGSEAFDANAWRSEEFPQRQVRNYERLLEHVRQEFFCADPVKYEKVLRQIRTSKSPRTIRAYSTGMYVNENDTQICQMCMKPALYVDVTEIANYGIEMPQLNLCLCKNCSSRYKQFRDGKKEKFKADMTNAIYKIDAQTPADDYEIQISPDTAVHFTQTHIAEVKEILALLRQYGVPGQEEPKQVQAVRNNATGKQPQSEVTWKKPAESQKKPDSQYKPNRGGLFETVPPSKVTERKASHEPNKNTAKPGSAIKAVKPGMIVYHKSYGKGVVTSCDGTILGVSFTSVGDKRYKFPDVFNLGYMTLIN